MYFCTGGPYDGRMVSSSRVGFVLTDMGNEVHIDSAEPWVWIYEKSEVWVGEGEEAEMRGYRWKVRDESGEAFDPDKHDKPDGVREYDVFAYDSGIVEDGVEVGL